MARVASSTYIWDGVTWRSTTYSARDKVLRPHPGPATPSPLPVAVLNYLESYHQ